MQGDNLIMLLMMLLTLINQYKVCVLITEISDKLGQRYGFMPLVGSIFMWQQRVQGHCQLWTEMPVLMLHITRHHDQALCNRTSLYNSCEFSTIYSERAETEDITYIQGLANLTNYMIQSFLFAQRHIHCHLYLFINHCHFYLPVV